LKNLKIHYIILDNLNNLPLGLEKLIITGCKHNDLLIDNLPKTLKIFAINSLSYLNSNIIIQSLPNSLEQLYLDNVLIKYNESIYDYSFIPDKLKVFSIYIPTFYKYTNDFKIKLPDTIKEIKINFHDNFYTNFIIIDKIPISCELFTIELYVDNDKCLKIENKQPLPNLKYIHSNANNIEKFTEILQYNEHLTIKKYDFVCKINKISFW